MNDVRSLIASGNPCYNNNNDEFLRRRLPPPRAPIIPDPAIPFPALLLLVTRISTNSPYRTLSDGRTPRYLLDTVTWSLLDILDYSSPACVNPSNYLTYKDFENTSSNNSGDTWFLDKYQKSSYPKV